IRERGSRGRPAWVRTYKSILVVVDVLAVLLAGIGGRLLRFGAPLTKVQLGRFTVPYVAISAALVPVWLGAIALGGAYDAREIGNGSEEYRRVFDSAVRVLAIVAILS